MAWIELEGAVNVRDLGGLPTRDGRQTAAARLLLRADNLQELTPADVARLVRDIGVTTVVDLRSVHERAAEGPAALDGVAGVRHAHHPVLPELGDATDVVAEALLARSHQDRHRPRADGLPLRRGRGVAGSPRVHGRGPGPARRQALRPVTGRPVTAGARGGTAG